MRRLGDPFIEGEILQFQQLTQELLEARQEVVDACTEVCHAQHIETLATSALTAARQAVDASAERFEQVGAYHILHPFLFRQSFRHVEDDETMVDVHNHLHCQLQVGGRPTSPDPLDDNPPHDIDDILARFDDVPMHDVHAEPFIQDGGDNNGYYE